MANYAWIYSNQTQFFTTGNQRIFGATGPYSFSPVYNADAFIQSSSNYVEVEGGSNSVEVAGAYSGNDIYIDSNEITTAISDAATDTRLVFSGGYQNTAELVYSYSSTVAGSYTDDMRVLNIGGDNAISLVSGNSNYVYNNTSSTTTTLSFEINDEVVFYGSNDKLYLDGSSTYLRATDDSIFMTETYNNSTDTWDGSSLVLDGNGGNTITVSGYNNSITDFSSAANTIEVDTKSGVSVDGYAHDTIVLTGYDSTVSASYETIQISGSGVYANYVSGNSDIVEVESSYAHIIASGNYGIIGVNTGGGYNAVLGYNNTLALDAAYTEIYVHADDQNISINAPGVETLLYGSPYGNGGNTITVNAAESVNVFVDQTPGGGNTINLASGSTGIEEIVQANYDHINVYVAQGSLGVYGAFNSVTFDSGNFPVVGGAYDSFHNTYGSNFVSITGSSAVVTYSVGNYFFVGDNSGVMFTGDSDENAVYISDGTTDFVYDKSNGAPNAVYVSGGSTAAIYTQYRGDLITLGGSSTVDITYGGAGSDSGGSGGNTINIYDGSTNFVNNDSTDNSDGNNTIDLSGGSGVEIYNAYRGEAITVIGGSYGNRNSLGLSGYGGSTVNVTSYSYVNIYQGDVFGAGNTIDLNGNFSETFVTGNYAFADTINIYGSENVVEASGTYIQVYNSVNGAEIIGANNDITDRAGGLDLGGSGGNYVAIASGYAYIYDFSTAGNTIVVNGVEGELNLVSGNNGGTDTIELTGAYNYVLASRADIDLSLSSVANTVQGNYDNVNIAVGSYSYARVYEVDPGVYEIYSNDGDNFVVGSNETFNIALTGVYGAAGLSGGTVTLGYGSGRNEISGNNNTIAIDSGTYISIEQFEAGPEGSAFDVSTNPYATNYVAYAYGTKFAINAGYAQVTFTGNDTSISVNQVEDSVKLYGYGNTVTFDAPNFGFYTDEITNYTGGNTVDITGGSSVQAYTYNDQIALGGGSTLTFINGSYGNVVTVNDGSRDFAYENSNPYSPANTFNVSGGSSLYLDNLSGKGDTVNISDGSLYLYGAGGVTVNVQTESYAYVTQGSDAGNTIFVQGSYSTLRLSGTEESNDSAADTVVMNGGSYNAVYANGDYIELTNASVYRNKIVGDGNTIAVGGGTTIYAYGEDGFLGVDTSYSSNAYVDRTMTFVQGYGNGVAIDGAYTTNRVFGEGAIVSVGAVSAVDLYQWTVYGEDGIYHFSGGNTVTVDTHSNYGTEINDNTSFNTINVMGASGAYVYTYGQQDHLNISGGSWVDLTGYGSNIVAIYDAAPQPNRFYDDSLSANTVDIYGAGQVFNLTKDGDTINITYGGSVSMYGKGGDTIHVGSNYTEDAYGSVYQGSKNGNTIYVEGYATTLYLSGRNVGSDTVVVEGDSDTIVASGAYIQLTGDVYRADIIGNGNTIAVDLSETTDYLEDGNIYIYRDGLYGNAHSAGKQNLYDGGNAITLQQDARVYDYNYGRSSTINVTNGAYVTLRDYYANGDNIGIGAYSGLILEGAGWDNITLNSGTYSWFDDNSEGGNTISIGSGSDVYAGLESEFYSDTINISGGSFERGYSNDNLFNVSGNSDLRLYGFGGNTINVSGGSFIYNSYGDIVDDTRQADGGNYSNTINITTAYSHVEVYTYKTNGDTINLGGNSGLHLYGYGDNTVNVVSDYSNTINDGSYSANTITMKGDVGLTLTGYEQSADTILVSGYWNYLNNGGHYIDMSGYTSLRLFGAGSNTVAVNGAYAFLTDWSTGSSAVNLADEASIYLYGSAKDTVTAEAGAEENRVNIYGASELVSLNANSNSTLSLKTGNTQFVNATGDTIDISGNNLTLYVYDSSFASGHSSDTFDVTGTNDTVKFVTSMISAAAAFGPTAPATLTVEDSYNGATAIGLVSHP